MTFRIFTSFAVLLALSGPVIAQQWGSGTAGDIEPGVTFYSGPSGGTLGVETMPGVQRFSGAVNGSAIEILPGVTRYNFNSLDSYADGLAAQAERDFTARRALDRENEIKKRLDRIERYQRGDERDRRIMDMMGR